MLYVQEVVSNFHYIIHKIGLTKALKYWLGSLICGDGVYNISTFLNGTLFFLFCATLS